MLERLVRHDRTKVGAADSDVYDIPNAFSGVPFPLAAAHTIGEVSHPVQYSVDFGHDILFIHKDRFIFRSAECHVQYRSLFGEVDLLPAKHRVDPCSQTGLCGKLEKELEGLIRNTILGVVEV